MSSRSVDHGVDSDALAFREHRHDVLNSLQLIRAYIQVARYSDAIRVIDTTAAWLQSLSQWQTRCKESGLVWTASRCPHLILSKLDEGMNWTENMLCETIQVLETMERTVAERGWPAIHFSICKGQKSDNVEIFFQLPIEVSWDEFEQVCICGMKMTHVDLSF